MTDKNMLQMVLDSLASLRRNFDDRFNKVDEKFEKLDKKIDGVEERLTTRIDKLGKSLAYLEDDTPTREEFDGLESRVVKVEKKAAS